MAVPSWTKEWRPLARDLCARMLLAVHTSAGAHDADLSAPAGASGVSRDGVEHSAVATNTTASSSSLLASTMHDALAVDRVVAQLYAHRFLEVHRKQVLDEVAGIAAKFQIHSLGERSMRLQQLAALCADEHHQVLKLLIELSESPTTASDEQVAVDRDEVLYAQQQAEQSEQEREDELHERLAEELFEISTNDEWYQQWEDSDDEEGTFEGDGDGSDGSDASMSDSETDLRIGIKAKSIGATVAAAEAHNHEDGDGDDPMDGEATHEARDDETVIDGTEAAILQRDELLLRYFPKAAAARDHHQDAGNKGKRGNSETLLHHRDTDDEMSESESMVANDTDTSKKKDTESALLSIETPGLLYEALQQHRKSVRAPHRIVHERTLVTAVFQALAGVDSLVFEVFPVSEDASALFSSDFTSSKVQLSKASRTIAVAHLSPSALHHFLNQFARAATNLQLLRNLVEFITKDTFDEQRCCVLEGLAQALAQVLRGFDQAIWRTEQRALGGVTMADSESSASSSYGVNQYSRMTLLSVYGELKTLFSSISWLQSVLVACFRDFAGVKNHCVSTAKRAKSVLDALYSQLEVEYVQGIYTSSSTICHQHHRTPDPSTATAASWSRYQILMHLFVSSLTPYLDLLHTMLFEKGHSESIMLHEELFFVTPSSIKQRSPHTDSQRSQSFKDALIALAPFEVDAALVPVFLAAAIPFLNEAITSRQMKNRYLQQREDDIGDTEDDHCLRQRAKKPVVGPGLTQTLSELFLGDLAASGVYGDSRHVNHDALDSAQLSVQNMPFNRTMKQCLLLHVEQKCRELNGAMASLFRRRLQYLDHVDALRSFVLMQQQDVFSMLSAHLLQQMQRNPVTWADSESINHFYQTAMQRTQDERVLSARQRHVGARLCVRINATQLKSLGVARKIDISALKCLYFTFSTPQPLRVLFSASIMQKCSRLATFLLQVKAVESAIIKFKRNLRQKRCFHLIESDIRGVLVQVNDMLHYTKSLMNYLSSQVSNTSWDDVRRVLETSESIATMDNAHEKHLDQLLNKFFLLEKHTTVIQYILTTFNHIMRFVSQVDELVNAVERNIPRFFPGATTKNVPDLDEFEYDYDDEEQKDGDGEAGNSGGDAKSSSGTAQTHQKHQHILLRREHKVINDEITKAASEFKRQSHFLVVMLTAMHKHGASPHVAEILTQLNFNFFYHQPEQQQQKQKQKQSRHVGSAVDPASRPAVFTSHR